MSDLDVRSRSVPPPFLVRFRSVPIYRRYKPHDRDESFGEVRTMVINVEPWFVGKDVAMMLGYAKPLNAVAMHIEIEDSLKQGLLDSNGGHNRQSLSMGLVFTLSFFQVNFHRRRSSNAG